MKLISREDATKADLEEFYTGKPCKWGHNTGRYTNFGAIKARSDGSVSAVAGLCKECVKLLDENGGMIGDTFEDIMQSWDSSHETVGVSKLPYMIGTKKMGYRVGGYCLISTHWYDNCSKLLWILAKDYIKCYLSKDNLRRIGKASLYKSGTYMFLHRYLTGLANGSPYIADHIDRDTLNNTDSNLRIASVQDNCANTKKKKGTSKYIGVDKMGSSYRARLYREGGFVLNTCFRTEELAAKAYDKKLREYHGSDFNVYNFPLEGESGHL